MSGAAVRGRCPGLALAARVQRRILIEDAPFELTQLGGRLEPKLVDEHGTARPVAPERVRLPAGSIEGEHQLAPRALAQRVLGDEPLEIRQHALVAAKPKICVDSGLDACEVEPIQPGRLVPRERARRQVGERLTAPQVERTSEERAREPDVPALERLPPVCEEQFEPGRIELAVLEVELV